MSSKSWWWLLALLLSWSFFSRVWRINQPSRYVFDEVYHAVTAKLIARNDPQAFEWTAPAPEPNTAVDWLHPPLAKYTQALSIRAFGETPLGWRLSSVVFGVVVVGLTVAVLWQVTQDRWLALTAGWLVSFDGLLLVQSRVAMNDIHVTAAVLATAWCYGRYRSRLKSHGFSLARWWLLTTGVLAGVAMATKWSGVFVLVWLGVWEAWSVLKLVWQRQTTSAAIKAFQLILALGLLPAMIYVLSYGLMFAQGKSLVCFANRPIAGECYERFTQNANGQWQSTGLYWSHFMELHRQIWVYQTRLEATHGYQSRPWQWFLNLRPVWYHVEYSPQHPDQIGNIYAFGNPVLFWLGAAAVVVSLAWLGRGLVRHSTEPHITRDHQQLWWMLSLYGLLWLPWQASPRIMFFYHYTPAVPWLVMILSWWLWRLPRQFTLLALALTGLAFVVWYPHWTGILVPVWWREMVYDAVRGWR